MKGTDIGLFIMVVLICFGIVGALLNKGWCFRTGSFLSALIACVGFSRYPFFGGLNDAGSYFGCLMLALGVTAWLLFRGLSIGLERLENACRSAVDESVAPDTGAPRERLTK